MQPTLATFLATLTQGRADAQQWGLINRNVARLVRTPGARPKERESFTTVELTAIIQASGEQRLYPLLVTAHATGLRISELLALRWDPDVDLERRLLHVRHQLGSLSMQLEPLKTPASRRTVPLPGAAVDVLRSQQEAQLVLRHQFGETVRSVGSHLGSHADDEEVNADDGDSGNQG